MYPFERFSEAAKKTLSLAQEEAERAHHSYIGTEHLLLGLLRSSDSLAATVLANLGIETDRVRDAVSAVLGRNERVLTKQMIPTSRVKTVIELAFEESRRGQRSEVTTGDMLVALMVEGEGIAAHVLKDMGVRESDVRAELAGLNVAGVKEGGGPGPGRWSKAPRVEEAVRHQPLAEGARVLVHEPEPPHRLWEGRVVAVEPDGLVVAVEDRPAGDRLTVGIGLIHPVPTGPTFLCEYCRSHL